jgi:hypothetical protein
MVVPSAGSSWSKSGSVSRGGSSWPSGGRTDPGRPRRHDSAPADPVAGDHWGRLRGGNSTPGRQSPADTGRCCRHLLAESASYWGLLGRGGVAVNRPIVGAEDGVLDGPAEVGGVVADEDDFLGGRRVLHGGGWQKQQPVEVGGGAIWLQHCLTEEAPVGGTAGIRSEGEEAGRERAEVVGRVAEGVVMVSWLMVCRAPLGSWMGSRYQSFA